MRGLTFLAPGPLQEAFSDHPRWVAPSRRFLPKPDSCRPPWEVRIDYRAHLQGVLGLHWRVSSAQSPGSYPVTCASAAPPNRRSAESSFGTAPARCHPTPGSEDMQTVLFREEGSASSPGNGDTSTGVSLNSAAPARISIWEAGFCPGGLCISARRRQPRSGRETPGRAGVPGAVRKRAARTRAASARGPARAGAASPSAVS